MVNLRKGGQKLRRIILLHFGLVTLRMHFGELPKSSFLDVSMTPKTNCFKLWRHQMSPNNSREIPTHFQNILLLEMSEFRKSNILNIFEKTGSDKS